MEAKKVLRRKERRWFLEQIGPFFARRSRSPNYMNLSNFQDIRRKWAKISPFPPKIWAPFLWLSPIENAFYRSGYGDFANSKFLTAIPHSSGTLVKMADKPKFVSRNALVYA